MAAAVAGITQVPFLLGERWAPVGTVYDGLVGMTSDQNMAYSFIRQAAEGHWLFVNRLTHIDHQPVLLNIEWLAVGRLTAWLSRPLEACRTAVLLPNNCAVALTEARSTASSSRLAPSMPVTALSALD